MIGSTYLNNNRIEQSCQYMYSQNLKSSTFEMPNIGTFYDIYNNTASSGMKSIRIYYNNKTGKAAMDLEQLENLNRLYFIGKLEDDWNGNGSKPINKTVVEVAENIIKNICNQPIIYPTGRDSIQMQYELEDKSYLEFEIFTEKIVCMKVPQRIYSRASFEVIENENIGLINKIVKEFYE